MPRNSTNQANLSTMHPFSLTVALWLGSASLTCDKILVTLLASGTSPINLTFCLTKDSPRRIWNQEILFSIVLHIPIPNWNLFLIEWCMLRSTWARGSQLELGGRKAPFRSLTPTNLSLIFTMILSITIGLSIAGCKGNLSATVRNTNG